MATQHTPTARRRPIIYPDTDGKPMAEKPPHRDWLIWFIQVLQARYADRPDVYISGNMMMYYEEGNPRASVSPDVFVTIGVPKLPERDVYLIWEEAPPTVVIEITSKSTRAVDQRRKRELYARLGVEEYFLYDPLGDYLRPRLQGAVLEDGQYRALHPDADGALLSEALSVRLMLVDGSPRLLDAATGGLLLDPKERASVAEERAEGEGRRADAAERRVEAEERRADAAERRVAELERRLAERGRNGDQANGGSRA